MKRFTDTDKWIKDRWFCELEPRYKLFWLYLIDQCDNVGVWEVNFHIANHLIGYQYSIDSILEAVGEKVHIFEDGKKWWIKSFIDFQHGELYEDSASKPIQSYITTLKKHTLWIPYTKGIHTLQGKGKGKGKGKGDGDKEPTVFYSADFSEWWDSYKIGSKKNAFEAWKKQKLKASDVESLCRSATEYKDYCLSVERSLRDGQGWLNGRLWETEWTHEAQGTKPKGKADIKQLTEEDYVL